MTWYEICRYDHLQPEFGMSALVGDRVVALFRTRDDELFAVGGVDPFCGVGVISRGIIGDRAGEPVVASPMLKQVFSLRTGRCLDAPEARLPVYPVRRRDEVVEVAVG